MQFTPEAKALLKKLESCRLKAYADQCKMRKDPQHVCAPGCKGKWTIGYGHTGAEVRPGLVWTQEQAEEQLDHDLQRFVLGVQAMAGNEPLTDNQFSALVIFAFNVGLMALHGSTALRDIRFGQLSRVPAALSLWNKVQDASGVHVVNAGLVARREAECNLWRMA